MHLIHFVVVPSLNHGPNEKTTPMLQTTAANDIYPFAVIQENKSIFLIYIYLIPQNLSHSLKQFNLKSSN